MWGVSLIDIQTEKSRKSLWIPQIPPEMSSRVYSSDVEGNRVRGRARTVHCDASLLFRGRRWFYYSKWASGNWGQLHEERTHSKRRRKPSKDFNWKQTQKLQINLMEKVLVVKALDNYRCNFLPWRVSGSAGNNCRRFSVEGFRDWESTFGDRERFCQKQWKPKPYGKLSEVADAFDEYPVWWVTGSPESQLDKAGDKRDTEISGGYSRRTTHIGPFEFVET